VAIDKRCIYGDLLRQADSGADALSFLLPPAQEQTLDYAAAPGAQGSAEFGDDAVQTKAGFAVPVLLWCSDAEYAQTHVPSYAWARTTTAAPLGRARPA